MKHLSAKQISPSSSLRDSEQIDTVGVKTQECMETQELSSQNAALPASSLQPSGTPDGPQGAPLQPSQTSESCRSDAGGPVEKALGVNGPVVCEDKSCMTLETKTQHEPKDPSRLQTPMLSKTALPNHVDIKTESNSPNSSCMQKDTTASPASDLTRLHHESAIGNSSGPNSSLTSQTKGI